MQAFADVVRAGKAHTACPSGMRTAPLRTRARRRPRHHAHLQPAAVLALWRVIESQVVPTSEGLGVGQIVWSPIAQGVLTCKYKPGAQAPRGHEPPTSPRRQMIERWMRDDVLEGVVDLEPLAKEADLSMAALAVAWVLQNPNVSSAIISTSRTQQVTDNVTAAGVRLDPDLKKRIDDVLAPVAVTDPGETANTLTSRPPLS